ncbi:MAG: HU family DNA-binding protein [Clostridia bacterium]|nr:HU family DNA-binding protein [Clostridia bacterium]
MNKCELVELLAKRTGFSKVCCLKVLEAAKETIVEVCSKGGQISVKNFGKFVLKERKSCRYFNPQIQRFCTSVAKKVIEFQGFDAFKYALDK